MMFALLSTLDGLLPSIHFIRVHFYVGMKKIDFSRYFYKNFKMLIITVYLETHGMKKFNRCYLPTTDTLLVKLIHMIPKHNYLFSNS